MGNLLYEIYQNKNEESKAFGKWYGRAVHEQTMGLRAVAQHIAEHGSVYTPDVVLGVLEKCRTCIVELLMDSKKVKIEGLGTFYLTMESSGADTPENYNTKKHVKGIHIRMLPDREKETDLTAKGLRAKVQMKVRYGIGNGDVQPETETEPDEQNP